MQKALMRKEYILMPSDVLGATTMNLMALIGNIVQIVERKLAATSNGYEICSIDGWRIMDDKVKFVECTKEEFDALVNGEKNNDN